MIERMKVLVCGGRNYADRGAVFAMLDEVRGDNPFGIHIIQGGAEGADALAREWAQAMCEPMTTYPANWPKHGKKAGPIRNQEMIDEGRPNLVVVFPGGRGTADMRSRAVANRVTILDVPTHAHSCIVGDVVDHAACTCECGATSNNTTGEAEWTLPPKPEAATPATASVEGPSHV